MRISHTRNISSRVSSNLSSYLCNVVTGPKRKYQVAPGGRAVHHCCNAPQQGAIHEYSTILKMVSTAGIAFLCDLAKTKIFSVFNSKIELQMMLL